MTNAAKTLVMTATYNEIENLPRLLDEVFAVVPDVDFLVVDDNSPDGTGDWCDRQAASDRRVRCIHRAGKLGLGTAIVAGMKYAIEHGYRYVLNMDADFSHHPRYLQAMIAGMEPPDGHPVDVMIGSRYVPGGGTVDWPLRRRLMSRAVNAYARWMLWLSARDCSGGYRCYRVATLAQAGLECDPFAGLFVPGRNPVDAASCGARIGETPIVFADREHGQSKINSREAVKCLRIIATLGLRNVLGK